jgi:N-acetylglucosaminyldiphosphoundecaprenol N-acetyl-beta-D-mannosaminyltransferase
MQILNIRVDNISKSEVLAKIQTLLASNEIGRQLITTNPEFILEAQKNDKFKQIINDSWLSVADGYGIRLAAKYMTEISNQKSIIGKFFIGMKIGLWGMLKKDDKLDIIKETITGTDLMPEICKVLRDKRQETRIFLLGGYGDTPKLVAEKLSSFVIPSEGATAVAPKSRNPLNFAYATFEENNIIEKINSFQPSVLFVAISHPRAQIWIDENLPKMPSIKLAIGVGGAFDYWSGKIKRAPENWQNSFEWLYRLFHQPKRLKRILNAWPRFPWKIFINSITK